MSLQIAAQHMASRGRGPDSHLVHMAPQEVAGLQSLAKAHGGSLTINPDTGLPEAGFLSSILPMVIGAGITAATGGAAAPWMVGLGIGGAQTLATGSLQKGLMAGLGAYGGAGLAGGLLGAGAAGAAEAGLGAMGPQTAAQLGTGFEASMAAQGAAPTLGATGASMGAQTASQLGSGFQADMAAQGVQPSTINADLAVKNVIPTVTQAPVSMSDRFSQMGQGIQNLGSEAGREAFMGQAASKGAEATGVGGAKGLMQYGYAAGMPLLMQGPEKQAEKEKEAPYRYSYAPGRVEDPQAGYTGAYTGERTYFNPIYTRTAADGGLMDLGPVGNMSKANESQMNPAYARGGVSDISVDPYSGAETFAEGGDTASAKAVRSVEQDPYYTMSGQSGDAFKYLMGQGAKPAPAATPTPAMAPVEYSAQPANQMPRASEFMREMSGQPGATIRPYTFDPVTGAFTAMPIIQQQYEGLGPSSESDGLRGANGGLMSLAQGGQSHLGDYSDGGRFLRNADGGTTSDGISDSIPASIGGKRPARLAENEFVIPARIVSELGNGSSEAGARRLYAMMDRIQKARGKTVGKGKVAVDSKAEKYLPA